MGLEAAMGAAVKAAREAFEAHGLERPVVVVNVAWAEDGVDYCAGSRVPDGAPLFLAEGLIQSAQEVEDRGSR